MTPEWTLQSPSVCGEGAEEIAITMWSWQLEQDNHCSGLRGMSSDINITLKTLVKMAGPCATFYFNYQCCLAWIYTNRVFMVTLLYRNCVIIMHSCTLKPSFFFIFFYIWLFGFYMHVFTYREDTHWNEISLR